jgi:ribosomal protein S18 acetylase RimI-like enzyme
MGAMMRKAQKTDETALYRFYADVCAAQESCEYGPRWHFGIYPAPEELSAHIENGEAYLCMIGSEIAAACVLHTGEDPVYQDVAWPTAVPKDAVGTVHLFAVHPTFRRKGCSDAMLDWLIALAKTTGITILRLDVVKGNLPAEKLYQAHGFRFVEEREVYYEDTGYLAVRLYELVIQDQRL